VREAKQKEKEQSAEERHSKEVTPKNRQIKQDVKANYKGAEV